MTTDPSLPDEVLFGRSGYLGALLFVSRHLGDDAVPQDIIHRVMFVWLSVTLLFYFHPFLVLCDQLLFILSKTVH